jgi:inosine-uridine nucleoside N-ribohydrolase
MNCRSAWAKRNTGFTEPHLILTGLISLFLVGLAANAQAGGGKRKFIIFTDMEPDDRVALNLFAGEFKPEQVLLVGTAVKHSGRKQVLAERTLDQLGFRGVPVFQGSGGHPNEYLDIASSKAARNYSQEGENILSTAELKTLETVPYSSHSLQNALAEALSQNTGIEIVMLCPPTDLVAVLDKNPELTKAIKHIHIMGGWIETVDSAGKKVLRTTYNWNMDPVASAKLMKLNQVDMTLYSSHVFKTSFSGGSINRNNHPAIIDELYGLRNQLQSVAELETATLSWDTHIMDNIPVLKNVIGPYAGQQFTPTDPAVVLGLANPDIIERSSLVNVDLDLADLDPSKGFAVTVTPSKSSKIRLVDQVDSAKFEKAFLNALHTLPNRVAANRVSSIPCKRLLNPLFKFLEKI